MSEEFTPVSVPVTTENEPLEPTPTTEETPVAAPEEPAVSPDDAKPVGAATIVDLSETSGAENFPAHEENA